MKNNGSVITHLLSQARMAKEKVLHYAQESINDERSFVIETLNIFKF